jgi:uncharacterized protein
VADLINNEMVKKLDNFTQHHGTSRLQHSVNVAYYSFLICRNLNLDYKSAARAGILHDLFLYDWRDEKQPEGNHAVAHPIVALRNAKGITSLNNVEEDAIIKHMWPITLAFPRHMESYIITFVDKYCACAEFIDSVTNNMLNRSLSIKCLVTGGVYGR